MKKAWMFAAIVLLVCITSVIISPVMAVSATFVPAKRLCPCGGQATVEVTISGIGNDFGVQGDQQYTMRLVESDIVDDEWLFQVVGKYPAFVAWNDPVAFKVVFRLECSVNCLVVWGVRVDSLDLQIKGGAWMRQALAAAAPIPAGQYMFTTPEPDTDDGGELELAMEFWLSTWNVGSGEFDCVANKTVGGCAVPIESDIPVDKFSLLAPYIASASTILVATAATAIYVKRRKKRQ